jgi:hypothetical protein
MRSIKPTVHWDTIHLNAHHALMVLHFRVKKSHALAAVFVAVRAVRDAIDVFLPLNSTAVLVDYGRWSRYMFQLADNTADHSDILTMHAENEVG